MTFFDRILLGNTYKSWLIALAVTAAAFASLSLLRALVHRRLAAWSRRTSTDLDDLAAELVHRTGFYLLLILSVFLGSLALRLTPGARTVLGKLIVISFLFQGAEWGNAVLDRWIRRSGKSKKGEDKAGLTMFVALGFTGRLVLWSLALLLALDNLGVDITALIAGLGVGGVAVALAVQNVLGDLFASISIVLDKPFVIGDFIIVDHLMGTVEHIGLKTTRLRSLSGEQLVFANSDLLKSRIRNFKRMTERRISFTVGVTYQTPPDLLEALPDMIRRVVESRENARFDRSHFKGFGPYSLDFETVYYVTTPDYTIYMDVQQAINLDLCRRFGEAGIEFAYPTQSLYLGRLAPATEPADPRGPR